jgi:hypothetical protein
MPTFRHGKVTALKITDSAGTLRDISNVLRQVDFPREADTAETSAFGTFDKTYVVGLVGSSLSCSGMFDATVDGYLNGIRGLDIGGAYTGVFQHGPEGTTSGRVRYNGVALCTSYSITNGIGDMVGFTSNFQITGAVTRDTWP